MQWNELQMVAALPSAAGTAGHVDCRAPLGALAALQGEEMPTCPPCDGVGETLSQETAIRSREIN